MQIAVNQSAVNAPDGKAKLEKVDDWGFQPFIGAIYKVSDRLTLGAIYRAEMEVDLEGDLRFQGMVLPTQPSGDIDVGWDNPQLLEIGLSYRLSDSWMMFANADWEDWSAFSDNEFTINLGGPIGVGQTTIDRNWDDTWHLGVGFAKQLAHGELVSFGFSYDSSVVSNSDRTIDLPLDRQVKVSLAYGPFKGARFDVIFGLTITDFGKGKTTQTAQGGTFAGEFDPQTGIFLGFSGIWHKRGAK
jgi:long-chain fatty acid transport protein